MTTMPYGAGTDGPPAISPAQMASWILSGHLPDWVVESIGGRVVANDRALAATSAAIDMAKDAGAPAATVADWRAKYVAAWGEHQVHKFYMMVIPDFRAYLYNHSVQPPSWSVVRANSRVLELVRQDNAMVAEMQRNGDLFAGYRGARFGAIQLPVIAGALAFGIASVLGAVWAMNSGLATIRGLAATWVVKRQQDLVAAGQASPDSVAAVAAGLEDIVNPEAASTSPFSWIPWAIGGVALIVIGPRVLDLFKKGV